MKKSIFLFFAAILCATNAWAWCGNSFITVNGTWCTGSNSYVHTGGKFDGKNLGTLTAFKLGGELQVYPKSSTAASLCYKIDGGAEVAISLPKTGEEGNNSKHSGEADVDLSTLSAGNHTIAVWFKHNSDKDDNGGKNFTATFTIAATTPDPEPEPEPVADVTVHFINTPNWDAVACHHWAGGSGTSWPGDVLSKTDEIAGYDVYTATFTGEHTSCIFNNNNKGSQTGDLTVVDGNYYALSTDEWYADKAAAEAALAAVVDVYTVVGADVLLGTAWDLNNADNEMTKQDDGSYVLVKENVDLAKTGTYEYKVVKNHDWNKGQWPERDGENDNNWILQDGITADGLYTITITFNESTKEIQATATKTGDIVIKDFSNQPATLYFHPSFHWTSDYAQFAAYFYNNGPGADATPTWVNMTDANSDGIYEVANAKQHEYVIICRMNPGRAENNWEDEVMWNQIEHGITIPNTAGDLNTCLAFWTNCQGDVPTSECTWVAPTPLTDKNWDAFVAAYNGQTINAVVERSFKSGQNQTLCLPFDLPTNWLGDGSKAYQLNSIFANTADELQLNASECTTIEAGKPYIVVPVKGEEYEHIIINNVTVKNASAGTSIAIGDGYKATLKAVTTTDGTQTNGSTEYYVGANDGYLYNAVVDKLGLRAIIELTTVGGQPLPAKVRARVVNGLDNITNGENTTIKVIENGQLIIIRDGIKYNTQGVRF